MSKLESLSKDDRKKLFAYALRLTKSMNNAEDLIQDTFLMALNKQDKYKEGNYYGWVKTMMFRIFINNYRRKRREEESLGNIDMNKCHYDKYEEISPRLIQALGNICSDRRDVILDLAEELTYKEIAKKRDIKVGTVMSRIYRGRTDLAKELSTFDMDITAY